MAFVSVFIIFFLLTDHIGLHPDRCIRSGDDGGACESVHHLCRGRMVFALITLLHWNVCVIHHHRHPASQRAHMPALWPDLLHAGPLHVPPPTDILLLQPQRCLLGHSGSCSQAEEKDSRGTVTQAKVTEISTDTNSIIIWTFLHCNE